MITYDVNCFCCKKTFQVLEGTRKYQMYKRNMKGRFACDICEGQISLEARANLFGKLRS